METPRNLGQSEKHNDFKSQERESAHIITGSPVTSLSWLKEEKKILN